MHPQHISNPTDKNNKTFHPTTHIPIIKKGKTPIIDIPTPHF